jgi:hypothetical protein
MAVFDVLIVVVLIFSRCYGQNYPFKNTSLSFEDRVKVSAAAATNVNSE